MLATMAKKKPGRPPHPEPRVAFQVRIPQRLYDALVTAATKSRRFKGTEVEVALEKHLAELGLWEPDEPEDD